MSHVLEVWQALAKFDDPFVVSPDGCRDLIVQIHPSFKPKWHISPLQHQSKTVAIKSGILSIGYRLKPGVTIDEKKLLESVQNEQLDPSNIQCQINSFTNLSGAVTEALDCLAINCASVKNTAIMLGVSERTLQRLILKNTGTPPNFWVLLARIRKCARNINDYHSLSELALAHGYCDQAHMTREFKRWLNISPNKLRLEPIVVKQMHNLGYY